MTSFIPLDKISFVLKPSSNTSWTAFSKLSDSCKEDQILLGHLMLTVGIITKKLNIDDAFNVVINNGEKAGMTVPHLHLHILSGKKLSFTA